ncbi:MAG: type II secretion system protein GspK [Phycisphaerales bacterium]
MNASGTGAPGRRGSTVVIVIWAVAIASIVVAATQVLSWRQATQGKEALARVQARWAARAGVETMIAIMEYHAENPDPDDAFSLVRDMEDHAIGETDTGEYDIRHFFDGREYAGPMDEHGKLNVNLATRTQLVNLPYMTPDTADAIVDWRDANDEVEGMGAESDYYANRGMKYRPRNADFRSIAELELVAGVWPEYLRGEDWNLNGRLDPNENDGKVSAPEDKPDDILDAGWSGYLTALSRGTHTAPSGQPKLYLRNATADEIVERLGVDQQQATALINYAKNPTAKLETLLLAPLSSLGSATTGGGSSGGSTGGATGGQSSGSRGSSGRSSGGRNSGGASSAQGSGTKPLDTPQLRAVLQEASLDDPAKPAPGRLNLNTASADVLKKALGLDPKTADAIVQRRNAKPEGLTSLVDLLDIPAVKPETIAAIAGLVDVQSSVYSISSRGRARGTGTEVDLFVVVDRSTNPVTILEVREP